MWVQKLEDQSNLAKVWSLFLCASLCWLPSDGGMKNHAANWRSNIATNQLIGNAWYVEEVVANVNWSRILLRSSNELSSIYGDGDGKLIATCVEMEAIWRNQIPQYKNTIIQLYTSKPEIRNN